MKTIPARGTPTGPQSNTVGPAAPAMKPPAAPASAHGTEEPSPPVVAGASNLQSDEAGLTHAAAEAWAPRSRSTSRERAPLTVVAGGLRERFEKETPSEFANITFDLSPPPMPGVASGQEWKALQGQLALFKAPDPRSASAETPNAAPQAALRQPLGQHGRTAARNSPLDRSPAKKTRDLPPVSDGRTFVGVDFDLPTAEDLHKKEWTESQLGQAFLALDKKYAPVPPKAPPFAVAAPAPAEPAPAEPAPALQVLAQQVAAQQAASKRGVSSRQRVPSVTDEAEPSAPNQGSQHPPAAAPTPKRKANPLTRLLRRWWSSPR